MIERVGGAQDFTRCRYIIIGAGPAGLAFGIALQRSGEKSFVILEKETQAGGLCRSAQVDGYPLDIAGCHLLEYANRRAAEFVFSFLPREKWKKHARYNCVQLGDACVGYPFEANIWQLPAAQQARYLADMARADANRGVPLPENLYAWAFWNFGEAMARDYFIPYNEKIWSCDLSEIGTHWMYKLPPICYADVKKSCEERRSPEKYAAHKNFYYPTEDGFGEPFARMANALEAHIVYDCEVRQLDWQNRTVNGLYQADIIVNTAPWRTVDADFPPKIRAAVAQLKHVSLDIDYHPECPDTRAQAIYYPDKSLPHHRAIFRYNYNEDWPGYWTETNARRSAARQPVHFHNEYAYPINTRGKPAALQTLQQWSEAQRIFGLGRWGQWEHMNCDTVICNALDLAERLRKE